MNHPTRYDKSTQPTELRHLEHAATDAFPALTPIGGARALRALAIGALAVGALALGALAIGRLVVGFLAIGKGRIRRLEIEELDVKRLRVGELEIVDRPGTPELSAQKQVLSGDEPRGPQGNEREP